MEMIYFPTAFIPHVRILFPYVYLLSVFPLLECKLHEGKDLASHIHFCITSLNGIVGSQ